MPFRIKDIRPIFVFNLLPESDHSDLEGQIEAIVQAASANGHQSNQLYKLFETIRHIQMLMQKRVKLIDPNSAFQLESELRPPSLGAPILDLATTCLEGQRDGLYEVYNGLGIMRHLVGLHHLMETFAFSDGISTLIGLLFGSTTKKRGLTPSLIRFLSGKIFSDIICFSPVAEKLLSKDVASLVAPQSQPPSRRKNSPGRSRSRSGSKHKKSSKNARQDSPAPAKLDRPKDQSEPGTSINLLAMVALESLSEAGQQAGQGILGR